MFSFTRNCRTVSPSGWYHLAFPPAVSEGSHCSTCLPAFGGVSALDLGRPNGCVEVSHYFNLQFPNDLKCAVSFHRLMCHLYMFGELSVQVFCPFFHLVHFLVVGSFVF